ncbi:hypothetical protein [Facilibium subflavum]|uniref:hypothetical protein n=1 Tax=Facilibium subflavum TaxID=2219058 RepID=UPI000E6498FC|nr:hypothetical protein [Facilibium subflavum]
MDHTQLAKIILLCLTNQDTNGYYIAEEAIKLTEAEVQQQSHKVIKSYINKCINENITNSSKYYPDALQAYEKLKKAITQTTNLETPLSSSILAIENFLKAIAKLGSFNVQGMLQYHSWNTVFMHHLSILARRELPYSDENKLTAYQEKFACPDYRPHALNIYTELYKIAGSSKYLSSESVTSDKSNILFEEKIFTPESEVTFKQNK